MAATSESVLREWFEQLWNRGDETTIDKELENLLDEKYGKGEYKKGPGSEFSQAKKWFQNRR